MWNEILLNSGKEGREGCLYVMLTPTQSIIMLSHLRGVFKVCKGHLDLNPSVIEMYIEMRVLR